MNPIPPAAGQSQAPAAPESAGTVCIAPQGDGTFMVYLKHVQSMSDPLGQRPDEQPAADIDAALDTARKLLGGEAQQQGSDTAEADALFNQGFNNARGTPLNGR